MAKTFTAPFAQTPKTTSCVASTAFALTGVGSVADDTPGSTLLLMTAGTDGALVTSLRAIPRATNTATLGALFIRKSTDAAGKRVLLDTVTITAQTLAATSSVTTFTFALASEATPLRLDAGDELYFGLGVTQTSGITAHAVYTNF